ncbi:putative MFS family arabinose efflux permease [Sinorhizobium fredii]|jgi:predicted MFS family arabinose efflux permease|uniref:Major facilitator (MFS) superfamily protein n=2 Tax=Rhizobium fredii TaxID=380 RepID=I3XBM3_SINF2|nr:MFS transporter [Sinorhizobium fredii]AFL53279.1 major facilitator (MFS) superfamily protein [Sinorhizobium fredii USDA 257]
MSTLHRLPDREDSHTRQAEKSDGADPSRKGQAAKISSSTLDVAAGSSLAATAIAGAVAMAVAMGFGRFSYTPILPAMMADAGLSPADAGLIASANFVGYLAGAVLAAYGWAHGHERRIGLAALFATTLLLAAMGLTSSVLVYCIIRFLAGLASAFAMIFVSGIVLGQGLRATSEHVPSVHFGGVGFGIALSSICVWAAPLAGVTGLSVSQADWFTGAIVALLGTALVAALLPASHHVGNGAEREAPLTWTRPLTAVTLTYGFFGFGYVITATFLVAMARDASGGHSVEFLAWLITGVSGALSVYLWRFAVPHLGLAGVYAAGLLVEAVGLVLTVSLPVAVAPLVGGLMLGATFMMVTAYGLQIGRQLAPESPRRALALMTAAFGIGQIVGPLVAGWLAERTGSFALPTLVAAVVLFCCGMVVVLELRRIRVALDR